MTTAMDAIQRLVGSGTIVALNVPADWPVQGKVPSAGVTPENPIDRPSLPSRGPNMLLRVRLGDVAFRDPANPVPEKVAFVKVAVRYMGAPPPMPPVISISPENTPPVPVTLTNVSNAGMPGNVDRPMKFVMVTGTDTPPPSALPAVDSVTTPPLVVAVMTSLGFVWPNPRTVPAWVDDPSRSDATHANAKERRKNRADNAS